MFLGIDNGAGAAYNVVKRSRGWGNLLEEPESGIMKDNPFRYRGYYYDSSIGLYYLNSRYYDPETGRFLNEDLVSYLEPETIGGINLYAYCLNDPVNNIDPSGHFVISLLIALAVTGAVVGGATAGLIASSNGARGWELAGSILGGALLGGAIGALAGLGLPMIGGTAGGALAIAGGGTLAMAGASVAASAVSVSLAGIAGIASILGIGLLFSKGRPGNNRRQNEQFESAMNRYGIKKQDPLWREIHNALHNEPPMNYQELLRFIAEYLGLL